MNETLRWIVGSKLLYATFLILFIFYLIFKNPLIAFLLAINIVAIFITDTLVSASRGGWKRELMEIFVAVLTAVIAWFFLGFILHTSAPLNAITSCSMLPNFDRGDMVVLVGGEPKAPEVEVDQELWDSQNWENEYLVCSGCKRLNKSTGREYVEPCLRTFVNKQLGDEVTDQSDNIIQYECGICERKFYGSGEVLKYACTKSIRIGGVEVRENLSNDVIVYGHPAGDAFQGETIHRVYAKIRVGDRVFYLTKGDNNEQLDIQFGNVPVSEDRVVGKVLFRIPFIGYVKLFLWGQFSLPSGCESHIVRTE